MKATAPEGKVVAADVTYGIGRHALSDLATQYRLSPRPADRLNEDEFDHLYSIVEAATDDAVERSEAMARLAELRSAYEPNAEALAHFLALDLPSWVVREHLEPSVRQPRVGVVSDGRDLVG